MTKRADGQTVTGIIVNKDRQKNRTAPTWGAALLVCLVAAQSAVTSQ